MLGFGALSEVALSEGSPGSASQPITGALFTNSNTSYGATLSATYTITGTLYSDADTFYASTVAPGSVTITGALFTDADTFYAATVSLAGAPQAITGALFQNVNAFYGATVTFDQTISGGLFVDGDTFFGATVSGGAQANDNWTGGGPDVRLPPKRRWAEYNYLDRAPKRPELSRQGEIARRKARRRVIVALDKLEPDGMLAAHQDQVAAFIDDKVSEALAAAPKYNNRIIAQISARLTAQAVAYAQMIDDEEAVLLLAA